MQSILLSFSFQSTFFTDQSNAFTASSLIPPTVDTFSVFIAMPWSARFPTSTFECQAWQNTTVDCSSLAFGTFQSNGDIAGQGVRGILWSRNHANINLGCLVFWHRSDSYCHRDIHCYLCTGGRLLRGRSSKQVRVRTFSFSLTFPTPRPGRIPNEVELDCNK